MSVYSCQCVCLVTAVQAKTGPRILKVYGFANSSVFQGDPGERYPLTLPFEESSSLTSKVHVGSKSRNCSLQLGDNKQTMKLALNRNADKRRRGSDWLTKLCIGVFRNLTLHFLYEQRFCVCGDFIEHNCVE